jgi:hypothetical protein
VVAVIVLDYQFAVNALEPMRGHAVAASGQLLARRKHRRSNEIADGTWHRAFD